MPLPVDGRRREPGGEIGALAGGFLPSAMGLGNSTWELHPGLHLLAVLPVTSSGSQVLTTTWVGRRGQMPGPAGRGHEDAVGFASGFLAPFAAGRGGPGRFFKQNCFSCHTTAGAQGPDHKALKRDGLAQTLLLEPQGHDGATPRPSSPAGNRGCDAPGG